MVHLSLRVRRSSRLLSALSTPCRSSFRVSLHPRQVGMRVLQNLGAGVCRVTDHRQGRAHGGLVARILVGCFVDHLSYYRQGQINARSNARTPFSTLAAWFGAGGASGPSWRRHLNEFACPMPHWRRMRTARLSNGLIESWFWSGSCLPWSTDDQLNPPCKAALHDPR